MELIHIKGNTYYIDNPSSIGVYKFEDGAVALIDTGIDDSCAKKVLGIIENEGWTVRCIINTHSHADHCGGNSYISKKTGCDIYTSPVEGVLIENPLLEPSYLYGAYPQKELHNKFLKAKPSKLTRSIEEGRFDVGNSHFDIVKLPGHSLDMIGIVTEDGVGFMGDALFPKTIISKHNLLFLFDYNRTIETLNNLKDLKLDKYVLSHGGVFDSIDSILDDNIEALTEVNDEILSLLDQYRTLEEIHKAIADSHEINEILPQYYLNISVIKAHLSALCDNGKAENTVIDRTVKWIKK